jgi:hypothetical protein
MEINQLEFSGQIIASNDELARQEARIASERFLTEFSLTDYFTIDDVSIEDSWPEDGTDNEVYNMRVVLNSTT